MRVLAIDPGDRTGVATYNNITGDFSSLEIAPIDQMLSQVCRRIVDGIDIVIVENFIIHPDTHKKKKPERWPLEMIGAIRWMCYECNVRFILQNPAQRLWMDNDKLKALGWYKGTTKDYEGHADDAARHLGVYFGVTRQDKNFLRRLV